MKPKGNDDRDQCYAAWVGFDWGDQEHVWALQWTDTGERERGRLEQTPEALDVWIGQLMSRLNCRRIAVAIEQKHGAVVWMLLKYECVEIYPVHPQAAGQFRQALYPSGSKNDPADGELLLDFAGTPSRSPSSFGARRRTNSSTADVGRTTPALGGGEEAAWQSTLRSAEGLFSTSTDLV
jgi:transposase